MRSKEKLAEELEFYIKNGYMENLDDSRDEPYSEAEDALSELSDLDPELCKKYCKIIMATSDIRDSFFDAKCFSILFNIDKEYCLDYLNTYVDNLSPPMLYASMDGLCQYSNTSFRKEFSDELITKIKKRYDELSSDKFYKEMMMNSYCIFSQIFLKPSNKI